MTGFGTPGGNISRQFDVDRYFLDRCRDTVVLEIACEAVSPDSDIATGFGCLEQLRPGVEKLVEGAAVRQSDVDGHPWCKWTVRADIGLGIEDHDDGRTIFEMGIEVPPFILAPFRADALTVLKLGYFVRSDPQSAVIEGMISQPKVAFLTETHGISLLRQSWLTRGRLHRRYQSMDLSVGMRPAHPF